MSKNDMFTFQPLSQKRSSEVIAMQIEEAIFSKRFKLNDRLPSERELAVQFNTGRGTVREALRILEGSGLILVKPGGDGGIFVKEIDSSTMTKTIFNMVRIGHISIQDVTEIRVILEMKVIEHIIDSLGEAEIAALEDNIVSCEKLIKNQLSPIDEIQNFHRLLASFCKNFLLVYLVNGIVDLSDTFVKNKMPGKPLTPSHIRHHKSIVDALKRKDLKAARKAICNHLRSVDNHLKVHYTRIQAQETTNP